MTDRPIPPVADIRPTSQTHHGVTLHDDYAWLRAANWQEAMRDPTRLPADIAAYLNAENAYYDAAMAHTTDLQETLVAEMRGRIKEDDSSVPEIDGPFAYARRFDQGGEYPIFVRGAPDADDLAAYLDVNVLAADEEYFDLGGLAMSPDHSKLAWSADTNGSEYYTLRIRDLATGRDSDTAIPDVGSFAWMDDATLIYARVNDNHRPDKIFRHVLGTDPADDVLVYQEDDNRFFSGVGRSRSGAYTFIATGMNDCDEILFIPNATPDAAPQVVAPRTEGVEYDVEDHGDRFIIRTNRDDALDFKLVTAPIATPGPDNWTDLVPHRAGRMIVGYAVHRDWLLWIERENALPAIRIMPAGGDPAAATAISFEEEAYALGFQPSPDYATNRFRFSYTSPTTPAQVWDYDLASGARTLRKTAEIPSGHDPADYVTRRVLAPSHDGAEVPVTLLHHKDTAIDGSAPCFLTGYGSYGMAMPSGFNANRLSLVDRGFVVATAHVRGGSDKGRAWYEDAKFGRKVNTFHDMIAAGQHLIASGYTDTGRIVIQGGSAGGLLVGAVANMAPDLLAGVVADVPFVDVLNTILDDTLPLTPGEWSQWGNPIDSREAFDDIRGYSPYDNVTARAYPPMLVTAGVSDPRVTYWEPAKWVAKLRATKTDDNLLLMRTNMTSGHFGKTGRFAALEDAARTYAFAIMVTDGA